MPRVPLKECLFVKSILFIKTGQALRQRQRMGRVPKSAPEFATEVFSRSSRVQRQPQERTPKTQVEKHTDTTSLFLFHPFFLCRSVLYSSFRFLVLVFDFLVLPKTMRRENTDTGNQTQIENALFFPILYSLFCVYLFFLAFTTRHFVLVFF